MRSAKTGCDPSLTSSNTAKRALIDLTVIGLCVSNAFCSRQTRLFERHGLYPFSAVVYRQTLEEGIGDGAVLAHTFQTSALGCYAACAVADYIDSHDVDADCRRIAGPLADAAARIVESDRAQDIYQIGPSLSFRPAINAGDLVKACFDDRVLILGGGIDGERIRIAPPLTIETKALQRALEVLLSRLGV